MIEINDKVLNGYSFIDLFAGIGGFRLALESFGAKCVYSSEKDEFAKETYFNNFGDIPDGDITKVDENDIPEHDILCAGFPCQAFSISGKKLGFNDTRGTLFFDVARIAKAKKPKVVFMENVKNFETHDNGKTLSVVKKTMEEIGYKVYYKVLSSSDYNIPQKRERIYIVCFRDDVDSKDFEFPKKVKLTKFVKDIILDNNETSKMFVSREDIEIEKEKDKVTADKPIRIGKIALGRQGERVYSINGVAITLSANGGGVFAKTGGYLIDGGVRRLNVRECARLQGFPDTYKVHPNKNQAYKQFGNSVTIDVLQYILKNISKVLNNKNTSC